MYETIRVESRGDSVARLVLARPPLNVLNIAMLKELSDAVDELAARLALRVLVIAAEGHAHALGGGCELAVFCDLVLASEKATFGQPEIQLGLFPPVTAAAFPYFVHGKKTLELMLTGERVDAREAQRIGLVNQIWPAEEFAEEAASFVERLASRSGAALRLPKKAYYAGGDGDFP